MKVEVVPLLSDNYVRRCPSRRDITLPSFFPQRFLTCTSVVSTPAAALPLYNMAAEIAIASSGRRMGMGKVPEGERWRAT